MCRLCMEANTVSSDELCHKYGVDYSDLIMQLKGQVFYFTVCTSGSMRDDRVCMHYSMEGSNQMSRSFRYLFWLPHLRNFIDLSALCQQQKQRREAAQFLSSAVQRHWILIQRHRFAHKKHNSIDCLVLTMRRNEKKRLVVPYGLSVTPGGPSWAFPERPRSGQTKFTTRNQKPLPVFYRVIEYDSDLVV